MLYVQVAEPLLLLAGSGTTISGISKALISANCWAVSVAATSWCSAFWTVNEANAVVTVGRSPMLTSANLICPDAVSLIEWPAELGSAVSEPPIATTVGGTGRCGMMPVPDPDGGLLVDD